MQQNIFYLTVLIRSCYLKEIAHHLILTNLHQHSFNFIFYQDQIWFSSYLQNRHQSVKLKTLSQIKSHSDKEFHWALCWDQCFLPYWAYTTPPSAIISLLCLTSTTIFMPIILKIYMSLSVSNAKKYLEKLQHCVVASNMV